MDIFVKFKRESLVFIQNDYIFSNLFWDFIEVLSQFYYFLSCFLGKFTFFSFLLKCSLISTFLEFLKCCRTRIVYLVDTSFPC